MKKKILALCLVVVLVATAITGVTLAYFTDTAGDVTNTFTVGKVDIKLDEAVVEKDGEDIKATTARTEKENDYTDIRPGQKLPKDPTVTVLAGSEPSYVRMTVTVEDMEMLAAAFPTAKYDEYWGANGMFLLEKLVDWNKAWKSVSYEDGVYEFRYNEIVDGEHNAEGEEVDTDNKLPALFTTITIPAELTNAEVAKLNGIKIIVHADAIQAAGFEAKDGKTAEELAWEAFDAVDDADVGAVTEATESVETETTAPADNNGD